MATATKETRTPEDELARIVGGLWTVHEAIRGHLQLEDREELPFWWGALDHAITHVSECCPIPKGFHGPRRVDTVVGEVDLAAMADVLDAASRHLGEALSDERRTLGRLQEDLRGWVQRVEAAAADPAQGPGPGQGVETPTEEALLRYRKNRLIDAMKRLQVELEAAVWEAEELADLGALTRKIEGMKRAAAPYSIDAALTGVRAALEYLGAEKAREGAA